MATGDETDLASAKTAAGSIASAKTAAGSVASAPTATPEGAGIVGEPIELRPVDPAEYVERMPLTAGGMGTITVARDRRLGRRVALKELRANTPELQARFAREALLTAQLEHPGIVAVHEAGRWPNGEPFYAMRLVPGKSLDRVLEDTKSVEERIALLPHIIAVAEALAFAHDQRVIHRDLKPHNIMVGKFGETVVIDWGLGKNLAAPDDEVATGMQLPTSGAQTVVGTVMGTPAYMAPEQARGEHVDERADVYAIGAILFHVLAGKAPHAGSTADQILSDVAAGAPVHAREELHDVPPDLVAIVERAMSVTAAERYPSARELAADLRRFQTGQLVGAHRYTFGERVRRFVRRNRAAVAIATLGLVALAVVGVVALVHVMSARRVAERQREIAEDRLASSYIDRARVELAGRHPEAALAYAIASAENAPLEPRTRFIAARALESLPSFRRRVGKAVMFVAPIPDSSDFIYLDPTGMRRWSPERGVVVWEHAEQTLYGDARLSTRGTVYVTSSGVVEELSVVDGKVLARFETDLVGYIGSDPAVRWLAVPTAANTIDLFDALTRQRITTIPHVSANTPLMSPDGERLLAEVPGPQGTQQQVIIDRTGKHIATVCDDCHAAVHVDGQLVMARRHMELHGKPRVLIVDWTGKPRLEIALVANDPVRDLAFDPKTRTLAISATSGVVEIRDFDTGALKTRITIEDEAYLSRFDGAGRLWTIARHTGVYVHDVATGVLLVHWSGEEAFELAITHDLRWAVLASQHGPRAWRAELPAVAIAPSPARVWRTAFTRDGRLLTAGMDGVVGVFDRDGKELAQWKAHAARLSALQLIADDMLVTSGRDDSVAIWDLKTRSEIRRISGRGYLVEASPDGTLLAIGGDAGVTLWDLEQGTLVRELGAVPDGTRALHWSADGSLVGAIGEHGAVVVWARDGKRLRTIIDGVKPSPPNATLGVDFAFSPDAKWLARTGALRTQRLFSVDGSQPDRVLFDFDVTRATYYTVFDGTGLYLTGDLLAGRWNTVTGMHELALPTDALIFWLKMSADRKLLFGASADHTVHVWDIAQRSEIATIRAPDEVYQLTLSPDGTRLAAATLKSTLLVNVTAFGHDGATLRALAACRSEVEVSAGELVRRSVDIDACNRAAP